MNGVNERNAISRAFAGGKTFQLTSVLATTEVVEKFNYAGFGVITANQLTSVEFYVSYDKVTFEKLALPEQFLLSDQKAFSAPPEVWPFPYVKMVTNTNTSAVIGLIG